MQPTDQELMAYADDELGPDDTRRIERLIAQDPELLVIVERHRAMRTAAKAAYQPAVEAEMSTGLAGLVGEIEASLQYAPETNVTSLDRERSKRRPAPRFAWPAAAAASFVIGVIGTQAVTMQVAQTKPETYLVWTDDGVTAGRQLATALDNQTSGVTTTAITITASFIANQDQLCRQFVIGGTTRTGGIACHNGGVWQMIAVAALPAEGSYQAANGANDPLAAAAVQLGVKEKLSFEQEAEQIQNGWLEGN